MSNISKIKQQSTGTVFPIEDSVARAGVAQNAAAISDLNAAIEHMGGGDGQPVSVTLAANMNNTDTIYLYLGSEPNYNYGYIYVYINGAWTATTLYGKGTSPTATVTPTTGGATISVTDEDGTTQVTIDTGSVTTTDFNLVNSVVAKFVIDDSFQLNSSANSSSYLNFPTLSNDNQITHPKVLFTKDKFGGHYYWMAYTPYPNAYSSYENPWIVCSDDLINWVEPTGITNPIAPKPDSSGYYNSDTHLIYREDLKRLECWYRAVEPGEKIYRKTSTDGVNWSSAELLYTASESGVANILCPVVIYDYEESKYKIWASKNPTVRYFESITGNNWTLVQSTNLSAWHFDIIKTDIGYEAFVLDTSTATAIKYTTSVDGLSWASKVAILQAASSGWDNGFLYRSSAFKHNGMYYLYYAGVSSDNYWRVGLSVTATANDVTSFKGYISGSASTRLIYYSDLLDRVADLETENESLKSSINELEDAVFKAQTLTLSQSSASLAEEATLQLTATVTPVTAKVYWSSSMPANVTVSDNGLVTAVESGSATITAYGRDASINDTCAITVIPSVNLFDGAEIHIGYVNYLTGEVVAQTSGSNRYFDAVDISAYRGMALQMSQAVSDNNARFVLYDSSNTFISGTTGANIAVLIPSNATYLVVGTTSSETSIELYSMNDVDLTTAVTNSGKIYNASNGTLGNDSGHDSVYIPTPSIFIYTRYIVSGAGFDSSETYSKGYNYNTSEYKLLDATGTAYLGLNYAKTNSANKFVKKRNKMIGMYPTE